MVLASGLVVSLEEVTRNSDGCGAAWEESRVEHEIFKYYEYDNNS